MDSLQITTDAFPSFYQGAEGIRGLKGGQGEKVNTNHSLALWLTDAILLETEGCKRASNEAPPNSAEWKKLSDVCRVWQ